MSEDFMAANCLAVLQTHGLAARMVPKWLEILFDNQVERRLATRDQSIMWASVCKAWRFWFLVRLPKNQIGRTCQFRTLPDKDAERRDESDAPMEVILETRWCRH